MNYCQHYSESFCAVLNPLSLIKTEVKHCGVLKRYFKLFRINITNLCHVYNYLLCGCGSIRKRKWELTNSLSLGCTKLVHFE